MGGSWEYQELETAPNDYEFYCKNLPDAFNDKVDAIETHGHCIRFYEHADCKGKSLGLSPATRHRGKMYYHGFVNIISSYGNCFDADKTCRTSRYKRQSDDNCRFFSDVIQNGIIPGRSLRNPVTTTRWGERVDLQLGHDGRIEFFRARILRSDLGTGTVTNAATRSYARLRGRNDDDAVHILASRLGGPGHETLNIFPQNPTFNRGVWSQAEDMMYIIVDAHGSGTLTVRFQYDNDNEPLRPTGFVYTFYRGTGDDKVMVLINDLLNP